VVHVIIRSNYIQWFTFVPVQFLVMNIILILCTTSYKPTLLETGLQITDSSDKCQLPSLADKHPAAYSLPAVQRSVTQSMLPAAITSFHQHSHAPTQHQQAQLQAGSAGGQGVVVFGVKHQHATDTAVKAAVHGLFVIYHICTFRTYVLHTGLRIVTSWQKSKAGCI